jgi:Protein of unknown function (DUF3500)
MISFRACLIVALVACRAKAHGPAPRASTAAAILPANNAAAVVAAANAFAAMLTDAQRSTVQLELTHPLAAKWSNFPVAMAPRNGVFFKDLTEAQVAAALEVARLALSADGFARFAEIRAADDAFAKSAHRGPPPFGAGPPPGGPPPGMGSDGPHGPPPNDKDLFGSGNYMIAFLGKPSTTTPWLLQLGGHHIAFNIYFRGAGEASTPYFVGVQPSSWKDADGTTHAPLAPLHDAMVGLLHSLSQDQLDKAKLDARFSDVYVGPGRDGKFPPTSEGVAVGDLSADSKQLVARAIAAWTGDSAQAADYNRIYADELDQTKLAYSGSPELFAEGDYVRIDGPHVWIEFACQGEDHYHSIWRDRHSDYGAEFSL